MDINSVECSDVRSAGGELVGSRAYYKCFNKISVFDEIADIKQPNISLSGLYRISDKLISYKRDIEKLLLYDLTNTYFEGSLKSSGLSRCGHSPYSDEFDQ